jgi:hypothetical protein
MIRTASLAALLTLAIPAHAQDWRLAGVLYGPDMAVAIDSTIDRSVPAQPTAQVLVVFPAGNDPYAAVSGKLAFDCSRKLMRGLEGKAYDEAGKVVFNAGAEQDWSAPEPRSPFDVAYRIVCQNAPMGESIGTGGTLPMARGRAIIEQARSGN